MLARPAIASVLARPADGPAQVWQERRFVSVDGGAVRQGVIDRLVAVGASGSWTRAEIVDFKTDALDGDPPSRASLEAKTALYRGQMMAYREEVARQLGLSPQAISAKLVFTSGGVVAEVGAE